MSGVVLRLDEGRTPQDMKERFKRTLLMLGYATYEDYLNGPLWADFRQRYLRSGRPTVCRVCGCASVTLHHTTYERIGCESYDDVVPLCWKHHKAVHRWLETSRLGPEATERAIASVRQREEGRRSRRSGKGRLPGRRRF